MKVFLLMMNIYQMYVYSDRYHQATSRKEGIVILKSAIPLLIN